MPHMNSLRSAGLPAGLVARATWLRRAGVAGFVFFLVKGLLWLALPAFLAALQWVE